MQGVAWLCEEPVGLRVLAFDEVEINVAVDIERERPHFGELVNLQFQLPFVLLVIICQTFTQGFVLQKYDGTQRPLLTIVPFVHSVGAEVHFVAVGFDHETAAAVVKLLNIDESVAQTATGIQRSGFAAG